jgi:WhiB family transcriptional regulator, redox-sensing transcriptional regulator
MIRADSAACRNADPRVFNPAPDDAGGIEAARRMCARCPIRLDCLAVALAIPRARGIWGGLTEPERLAHRRRDRRYGVSVG